MGKERKSGQTRPEPVAYKKSIAAAFARQNEGKICPVCSKKQQLSNYRQHLDTCKLEEDDECQVLATYTGPEARKLRSGREIVLDDEEENETIDRKPNIKRRSEEQSIPEKKAKSDEESDAKRRRSDAENRAEMLTEQSYAFEQVEENLDIVTSENLVASTSSEVQKKVVVKTRRSSIRLEKRAEVEKVVVGVRKEKEVVKIDELIGLIDNLLSSQKPRNTSAEGAGDEEISMNMPYFVDFTLRILRRVLSSETYPNGRLVEHFWNQEDLQTMHEFLKLSTDARCLFLRLFLRKTQWLSVEKLGQKYTNIKCVPKAVSDLVSAELVDDENSLIILSETLKVADLNQLKIVAKKFKQDYNKGRIELTKSMITFSNSQKSIFGTSNAIAKKMVKELKAEIGSTVRIKDETVALFRAMFTVYSPTETNSALLIDTPKYNAYQEMLLVMWRLENGEIVLPAPRPCPKLIGIYETRDNLLEYLEAKELESNILMSICDGKLEKAVELAFKAKEMVKDVSEEKRQKSASIVVHLRKFSALWVLTRCISHGATALEKQKKYEAAVEWQRFLLIQPEAKDFCTDMRGCWWDRITLNLDSHLKDKEECVEMLKLAMEDESLMDKEKLLLQDRAERLTKGAFQKVIVLGVMNRVEISAPTLSKNLGDGRVNRFVVKSGDSEVECSVEEVVRSRYLNENGFTKGLHDEGSSWHTMFGVLFFDIIFDGQYEDVWLSELQSCPSDLNNGLYEHRKERFDERFEWLATVSEDELKREVRRIWNDYAGQTNRECNWDLFEDQNEFFDFMQCVPRDSLCAVLSRLAKEYRNCRSGFPDLTMWNPEKKTVAVIEVKGPGDRLSTKQRLWLDFFTKNGIRAEVCHVVAENKKRIG